MKTKKLEKNYSTRKVPELEINYNYYRSMTEVMNQMLRIKAVKRFFFKYIKHKGKILDLGCGRGADIYHLNKEFEQYKLKFVGVDLWKNSIKKLKSLRLKNCKFLVGNVENINLREKFDIILSLEIAEHLENFDAHLEVIKKHLKKSGKLIISTPNDKYLFKDAYNFIRRIRKSKSVEIHRKKMQEVPQGHINVMSFKELRNKLKQHNFIITDKERTPLVFGAPCLDRFYGVIAFLDQLLPSRFIYFGSGMVLAAKLQS